jgi:hypothetical protein
MTLVKSLYKTCFRKTRKDCGSRKKKKGRGRHVLERQEKTPLAE